MMFCPFCGNHLNQLLRFCISCGRSLEFLKDTDKTEGPSAQGTAKQPENAKQTAQPCPLYKQFMEYRSTKSKERQSFNCGPKERHKHKEKKNVQYSAAELLRLRGYLAVPPPVNLLRLHPDIALLPRRRYTHRGSRRSFHSNDASAITSIWSTTRRPRRPPERAVNSKALAIPARSTANASPTARQDNHSVNFGLLNIRSLTNKDKHRIDGATRN
ncbi:uncharacterized protein LOC109139637 [Larimichthys crocea]|uniref:uncharacterized protein LOC109139637 n=1 Tax=Larimichthys crocea TaxID=215358 RepID=UPI000F5F47B6|nr:uncharacterized protein LOC109139637 [Larimichthys crocea]